MTVPAFEWDNSIKIEVTEIKNMRKTALVGGVDNQERIGQGFTSTPVDVLIYEQRNRYHYLAKVGDDSERFFYSTGKECNKTVVARYIAKILDGTYDAEE